MAQAMGLPGEDDLEFQRIERRRRMADALTQSALEPIQGQQTGMYASPISPFQGAAKMLSAYLGGRGQDRADKDQAALVQNRNKRVRDALGDALLNGFKPIRQEVPGQILSQQNAIDPSMPALQKSTNDMIAGGDLAGIRPAQLQPSQGMFAATPDPSAMPQPGLPPRVAASMGDSMFQQVRPNAEGQIEINAPGVGQTARAPSTFKEVPRTIQQSLAYITQLEQDNNLPPGTLLNNQSISMLLSQQMEANKPQKLGKDDAIFNPDGSVRMRNEGPTTYSFTEATDPKTGQTVRMAVNPRDPTDMRPIGAPAPQDVNKPFLRGPNGEPVPNQFYQDYTNRNAAASAARVNQTVNSTLERKEQQAKGDLNVATFADIRKTAQAARSLNAGIDTMSRVLDKGDFKTGFAGDTRATVDAFFGALGNKDAARSATDAQTFRAAAMQAVLDKQTQQKGPQTDSDARRMEQTVASLGATPDANRFILSFAKAQNDRDIAYHNFYQQWWSKNKTYEGADDAWFAEKPVAGIPDSGRGNRSLFDEPALTKYRGQGGPKAGSGWKIEKAQ